MKIRWIYLFLAVGLIAIAAPPAPPQSVTLSPVPSQPLVVTNVTLIYTNVAIKSPTIDLPNVTVYSTIKGAVILTWEQNKEVDLGGYKLYYGSVSPATTNMYPVKFPVTTVVFYDTFSSNSTYWALVTATNTSGLESPPSNVITFQGH